MSVFCGRAKAILLPIIEPIIPKIPIIIPLVSDFESEIVTIQISSTNQEETIKLLGKELLPILKK